MSIKTIKTAEFVSPKHPDKLCDLIADTILDAYLAADPHSRVAVEVMGGHGHITISGEVTSMAVAGVVDIERIVHNIAGWEYQVHQYLTRQSPEIAQGVDAGGAGDQGIMIGYATRETPNFMPLEYELARKLCREIYTRYPFDGKTQVTIDTDGHVRTVVASFQNSKTAELTELVRGLIAADEYLINPAGEWTMGGFDADSGISGRKIIIDNYGPETGVGGGSFSGKDYTKVDRSGAYMARRIAVDHLKNLPEAQTVRVKLAYAIGKPEAVMAVAEVDGHDGVPVKGYDLTPAGIRRLLELDKVKWADTAVWGHFGREVGEWK
jgi:S-adenosylmethionine synthetase